MNIEELEERIINDLAVELTDEFDRNFERKGYFNEKWPETKMRSSKGSLMMRSGNLRRSIRYNIRENAVTFSSSLPYASIHNEGGEITVTEKMKRFFWAMYIKASGAIMMKRDKSGNAVERDNQKNKKLSAEAAQWKALALMKVGHKIKIEKRQFVGGGPQVDNIVGTVLDDNMKLFNADLEKQMRQ